MSLRRVKHTLLRMSAEEKVIGIGSIAVLLASFMPWYTLTLNFENRSMTETAFSGDLGVVGFIVFIMSLLGLLVLIGENMRLPVPQFNYRKDQILFFLMGQSTFLILLTIAIYTKRSLEYTNAELRFGIFVGLIGAFFATFAAYALSQKDKKKAVQEFFHQPELTDDEETEDEDSDELISHHAAHAVEDDQHEKPVEERTELFEEREESQEAATPQHSFYAEIEQESMVIDEEEPESQDRIPEDEMIEGVTDSQRMDSSVDLSENDLSSQGDFLAREAGIDSETETENTPTVEEVVNEKAPDSEKEKNDNKNEGFSMGFYEDK